MGLAADLAVPGEKAAQNGAATAAAIPRRLSPSAIDDFRVCPQRFYLGGVLRLPRSERPSPVLAQGNAVHAALERGMGLPPHQRTAENLERALRSVWPAHRGKHFLGREEEAASGREAIEMLRRYVEREDLPGARVLARERWVSVRLPTGIELFGKLDRLDQVSEDPPALEVVDYKVARGPENAGEYSLRDETSAADLYAVAAAAETGWEVGGVRFIYLKDQGVEVRENFEDGDLEAARQRLISLSHEILTSDDWPAHPSPASCAYCPWNLACDHADQVDVSELQPVEDLPF